MDKSPPYSVLEETVTPGEERRYEDNGGGRKYSSQQERDPSSWSGGSSPDHEDNGMHSWSGVTSPARLSEGANRDGRGPGVGGRTGRNSEGSGRERARSPFGIAVGGWHDAHHHNAMDVLTRGDFIGAEVGPEVGIDDVVIGGESDPEMPRKTVGFEQGSTPLLEDKESCDHYNDRFLGLHRSDSHFPSEDFESVRSGNLGQDLRDTFMQMEYRKVKRMTSAKYRDDPRSWIWGIFYSLLMLIYLFVKYLFYERYCSEVDTSEYSHVWNNPSMVNLGKEVVLVLVLGICFVSITDNFQSLATALTVYFLYMLTVFFFMFGDTVGCPLSDIMSEGYKEDLGVIQMFVVWLAILAVIWSIHLFYYYIMPFIVRETRMCFGWRRLRSVTIPRVNTKLAFPEKEPPNPNDHTVDENNLNLGEKESTRVREVVFQYRPLMNGFGLCWSVSRHTFLYRGEMVNGRPNGWGQWRDDSFYGESLTGYWKDGQPFGPFNSCEKGTGNIFSAVIVSYCSMRTEDWKCLPEDEREGPLTFGLACVECCISGDFYADFPNLTLLPEVEQTCTCVMRGEEGKFCNKITKLLPNMRHIEANQVLSSVVVSSTPEGDLSITGHTPDIPENGLSAKISAVHDKGQGMPSLVIHNWHYQTANEAIVFIHGYNIPLEWSLKKFGQMLAGAGYPSFIKPFLFSWPTGKLFFYTKAVEMCNHPDTASAFHHFLENLAHAGTKAVHILSHSMGIRLFLHAFAQPEVQGLFVSKGGEAQKQYQMQLASVTMCNPDYPLVRFRDIDYRILRRYCSLITVYSDQGDTALKYSAIYASERSLGRQAGPLLKSKKPLDLDVVDTTDLQDNMHAVRHSAFNINRIMLEDMRELIVQKKRAAYRSSRLVKKQANFFVFMTIPSMVNGNVV
mmetsp:Transcript_26690/g.41615  ORF Transcript_26690/g.41615 Transcript_26690/m.41615 type:complete len:902 (-) Transcript_26690:484-3189(-)